MKPQSTKLLVRSLAFISYHRCQASDNEQLLRVTDFKIEGNNALRTRLPDILFPMNLSMEKNDFIIILCCKQ